MVSFELGAKMHFFPIFVTLIVAFLSGTMGSHVWVGISFIFVLVITMVTVVPPSFGVGSHISVKVTNTLELFVTRLFWAR